MWRKRLAEAVAIITIGDGFVEVLAPREHSRLWSLGPPATRRAADWFAERPRLMRVLGASQVVLGAWLALRQYRDL